MSNDIVVCIKQVPHPDYMSKISLNSTHGTINREGVPTVLNPGDKNALEEALVLREKIARRVLALTMGPPQASKALEEALAMGVDSAIHLCDRVFAEADTLATARTLAYAIRKIKQIGLILCSDSTIDSGTGQVASQLADLLQIVSATHVEEIRFESETTLMLRRAWERGHLWIKVELPAVIAVSQNINQPRLPSIQGIMTATQKEIKVWGATEINAPKPQVGMVGSPTRFYGIGEYHTCRHGEIFQSAPEDSVNSAIDRMLEQNVL